MIYLSRRQWLQTTTCLSIATLAADDKPASLSFGFSLYGMKSLKLAEAIRACAEIGYDSVELALMPGYPAEPKLLSPEDRKDLRKRLADAKLALAGLMENLPEPADDRTHRANLDRLKSAIELGQQLSPERPPVLETVLGGKPADWDRLKERMAERLQAWAKLAASTRAVIAVKPHVAGALHTPEAALWLMKRLNSPWLRLAFDQSHFALRGLTLDKTFPPLASFVSFIHIKDGKGNPSKFEFLLPGEGGVDYPSYFAALKKASYRGPIVVEVSGQISNRPGYDPLVAAKRSYANIAPLLKKAGILGSPP